MVSRLSKSISPFYVMEVMEQAQVLESRGIDVIHLEIGEPDHNTDSLVCSQAIKAIKASDTKYTHSLGILSLREKIKEHYNSNYSVDISENNIVVTMGSSPALFLSFLSILNPGDEIILTDPHYACYPQIIRIAGGVPKFLRVYEKDDFQIDISKLKKKITKKTRAVLINSPSNPTGMLVKPEIMKELSRLGIPIISDEIYHGLVYGDNERSILEFTQNAIVVNGFSKLYSMTGWRLGYMIVPESFVRPVQKLQQNLFISASAFVQRAGVKALELSESRIGKVVKSYEKRRDLMVEGIRQLGFSVDRVPDGAFYVFVNAKKFGNHSLELAFDILENAHVALTPGIDFGRGGEGYLRFSYANSEENIKKGLDRLHKYFSKKRSK